MSRLMVLTSILCVAVLIVFGGALFAQTQLDTREQRERPRIGMPIVDDEDEDSDDSDDGGPGSVVVVDCAAGDSIAAALEHPADELTIEISGFCDENVVIRRDDVTLIGSDPTVDGIRGVEPGDDPYEAVVRILAARNVRLQNLAILEGERDGVSVGQSSEFVSINNCRLLDNFLAGVTARQTSWVSVIGTTISGGFSGIRSATGSFVFCSGCSLTGSAGGFEVFLDGSGSISQSSVASDEVAILVASGASFFMLESTATGQGSLVVRDGGELDAQRSTLVGRIFARGHATLSLNETVKSDSTENWIDQWSTLHLFNQSSVAGFLRVDRFSSAVIESGGSLGGDLICEKGGDAYCANPDLVGGAITGCTNCAGAEAGVELEVIALESPPVTATGNGVCSGAGSPCSTDADCPPGGGPCDISACTRTVEPWTALLRNVPLGQTGSPFNDIVLQSVTISYDWIGGVATTPDRVVGLGGVTVPAGSQIAVSFAPISFADLTPELQGQTANLTLVFTGQTVGGQEVEATASGLLVVGACP